MKATRRSRPLVIANFAITADGKISTRNRTPSLFTSPRDKRNLLGIRAGVDAVLVGRGTVASDAMTMGLPDDSFRAQRIARGQAEFPLRVVVTNSGRLSSKLRLFQARAGPLVIFTADQMSRATESRLQALGAEIRRQRGRAVNLGKMLAELRADHAVKTVVCEGGAALMRSLLEAELVDRIHLTLCPVIFGGKRAPTLTGLPGAFLPRAIKLKMIAMDVSTEGECFLEYRVVRPRGWEKIMSDD